MSEQVRNQWSSRLAFILVTAGAAVGLGNIWKFPYSAGENGGGAFVLVYLLCVLMISLPVMMTEILLGRHAQKNPIDTMHNLSLSSQRSPKWRYVGWLGALTLIMVLSFYSVVAGWSLAYFIYAITGQFNNVDTAQVNTLWIDMLSNPKKLILWHTVFLLMTQSVIALGVNQGIERLSRFMMPAMFIVLLFLVAYAAWVGDMQETLRFLFSFRFEDLSARAIISAMGQAFFTLATGAGAMLVYGSYLSKKVHLPTTALQIALLDTAIALLAGLAIFPIVFTFNLSPEEGPGLMFKVLPIAFGQLPGSMFIAALFFLLLFFAALTSSISMAEPLTTILMERKKTTRALSTILVGIFAWTLGLVTLFSFNLWSDVTVLGWPIFSIMTDLPLNIFLPLGGILFCIFTGWRLKKSIVESELGFKNPLFFQAWYFIIRYIAPLFILVIFISNLI